MKNRVVKKIVVLTLVAVMGLSAAACGSKKEEAATTEAPATEAATTEAPAEDAAATEAPAEEATEAPADTAEAGALTEEEYLSKAAELLTSMSAIQTEMSALDTTDAAAVKSYIETAKTPFVDFAAVVAPEKFAEAQSKFKSGCEAMAEYLDVCAEMLDPEAMADADATELTAKLTDLLTVVQNDFTAAGTIMDELTGGEGAPQ